MEVFFSKQVPYSSYGKDLGMFPIQKVARKKPKGFDLEAL
jgi:hypothetical protein